MQFRRTFLYLHLFLQHTVEQEQMVASVTYLAHRKPTSIGNSLKIPIVLDGLRAHSAVGSCEPKAQGLKFNILFLDVPSVEWWSSFGQMLSLVQQMILHQGIL